MSLLQGGLKPRDRAAELVDRLIAPAQVFFDALNVSLPRLKVAAVFSDLLAVLLRLALDLIDGLLSAFRGAAQAPLQVGFERFRCGVALSRLVEPLAQRVHRRLMCLLELLNLTAQGADLVAALLLALLMINDGTLRRIPLALEGLVLTFDARLGAGKLSRQERDLLAQALFTKLGLVAAILDLGHQLRHLLARLTKLRRLTLKFSLQTSPRRDQLLASLRQARLE